MKNLKQYNLERLESLNKNQGMHVHTHSLFGTMESMWNSCRQYHGEEVIHKANNIIYGSVGKSKSHIVSRIKMFWPKYWYISAREKVEEVADYITKLVDGVLMFNPGYLYRQPKAWYTYDEIMDEEHTSYRYRTGGNYYFDENNILRMTPMNRVAKPKQTRREYMEGKAKKARRQREYDRIVQLCYDTVPDAWSRIVLKGQLYELTSSIASLERSTDWFLNHEVKPEFQGTSDRSWYNIRAQRNRDDLRRLAELQKELEPIMKGDLTYLLKQLEIQINKREFNLSR